MIFKQETVKSWFSGMKSSVNTEVIQPFQNAEQVIWKYNQAIQHNSLTQKGWERLLAQSDDGLKAYLTSIKGTTASMTGYTTSLQGNITGFKKVSTAINQYNILATAGVQKQNEFSSAVAITNGQLGNYLRGLNGSKASLSGYVSSLVGATAKTVALQAATMALNAAVSMGLMTVIQLAIQGFDKLMNSAKRASEAADEAFSESNDKVQQNKEELKSLDELIAKYKELKENEELDVEGRKEVKELQNSIADLVGVQASNLDLVNGKLDDEIKKLDEISAKQAKNAYETATANYNNSKKSAENATGDSSIGFVDGYAYVGKREKEAEKILQDAGYATTFDRNNNMLTSGVNNNIFSTIVQDIYDNEGNILKGAQEKADYLQAMIDVLEQNGQRATDLYAGLIKQRDDYLKYIDDQQNAANSLVNSWITYSQFSNKELSKINVNSVESFENYRKKMIEEIQKDETVGQMMADGILSKEDLETAINDYMATSINFSTWYEQWIKGVQNTSNTNEITVSFINTLNSADYAEIKDELLELAKSGEITPETLSSTEEYAELLSKTETSAESATNQILDMLSAQEKLSGLSQGLDKLKTAYEEFKNEDVGFVTAETLSSLPDAFKNLPEFDLFSEIVGDPTSGATAIQQAFNDIVKAYMLSQDTLQGLVGASEHDIQSYIANIKQMGVTNSEEVVNLAVKALNTENELINGAQAELEVAYERHLEDKSYDYERYLKHQSSQNTALVNALGETYKADYDNWCELLHDKAEAYNQFIKALEESGIVYDSSKSVQENAQNAIKKEGYSPSEIDRINRAASNAELSSYLADKQKQALQLDLSQITTDFGTKYSPSTGSDGSSKDSNKPSEVTQEFNWIEKYLESFARRTEKIMNRISDYLSFKKNLSTIKSAIKSVHSELSANEQALAEYAKQMNAIGLDAKYVEKIKNGALEIETITGYETDGNKDANAQLIEKIEKYQDLYDKYTDIEDTIEDLRETEKEWLVKNLEYVNEYYQKLSDIKNLAIDKKQDNIDLKEAQGKKVTTSDYKKLVSYNEDYIKSLRTTYKKTNAEFNKLVKNGTIEKNSAEWFEWKETLAGLNSEIVQAKINNAEWKDEIEDLKIQKYTDAIDKLKIKNEELNDAISEREAIGLDVREKDYSAVVKNNNKQISQLEKQNALLYKYQSQVQKGSERWKEFQEQIDSNNSSIRQLNQSTTELIKNIANIPIEERDEDLEDSSNRLALLQKKYDNATSLQERKQILKLMEEEQKKQKEINEQAKNATKSNLSTSQNNLLSYKNNQQSIVQKAEGDVKSHETYISNQEKELEVLNNQEKFLNSKISALNKKIAKTKDKTLLKQLKKQKEKYENQLNSTKAQQIAISSDLELAKKELAKSKEELATAQKNVSVLSGFKEGEKMDTDGITDKDTLNMIKEYNLALEAYEQAEYDCAIADEEWTNQMRENAQNRLDIIKEEYEALIDLTNSYSDATNSLIDMRKLQGNVVGDELYESLINNSQKNVEYAYEEWQKHSQQMAENDYTNDPEGYQKALAENNRLQQAWYDSVKTAEEQLDNLMNTRIEALEEEKEKLQELHDLQERRYKLEEAKYNLEKAKQRTNLVYNGTEFVYQADTNAVKEAEKTLEDAEYDELINKIEDWIKAIEDAKEDINLYDADGNPLTNIDEIIESAKAFGDNFLEGLEELLAKNGYAYSNGEITKVQAFAEGGVVGKSDDDKFKAIAKSLGEDNLVAVKNGEMVLTKLQSNELYKKLVGTGTVPTPILDLKPVIPDNLVRVNTAPNIEVNLTGDMQFNEVQNVSDLSKAIVNGQLRGAIKQGLGRSKV